MLSIAEKELLQKEDPYWFEELFYRDLESWFSSDIACCDECYDDYLACWPHAYAADKAAFQCSSIDLECFYSGSRLRAYYTKEQFDKYICLISCPRCGNELKYNIWPYSLPFNAIENFESKINEISEIAKKTPFLLLENYFAREVYDAILNISKETEKKLLSASLFRARESSSLKSEEISEFDFPPNSVVSEGRYNHAGMPVLYLASDPKTCYHEMRGVPCTIAELNLLEKIKILDLTDTYDSHQDYSDLLSTLVYSALMSAKQDNTGWHRPKYVFSRFVGDCANSAGFDAIKYPSTRGGEDSFNIVIINSSLSISKHSKLIDIVKYGEHDNTAVTNG
ncbi:RES family NAD+ phosphorylase [Pseudomonas sp. 6D_7.1_Bac1]|uniref:RES family NAD+ phosphorylase n=1 Tax=Pseudomonas sp. 6D_7.1_Bac1 TaxID=2971615 RepID=UPI0021C9E19D|nr:RES family NAD+ phosphorylase [Pseudomonas sp. 6D_7.1_Bac1]MCU1751751.1 RES family NAD+ phosphorylase [Pseudomonas sp. 6D_7.1_Bac1]